MECDEDEGSKSWPFEAENQKGLDWNPCEK
jgi:hypothetical protein